MDYLRILFERQDLIPVHRGVTVAHPAAGTVGPWRGVIPSAVGGGRAGVFHWRQATIPINGTKITHVEGGWTCRDHDKRPPGWN